MPLERTGNLLDWLQRWQALWLALPNLVTTAIVAALVFGGTVSIGIWNRASALEIWAYGLVAGALASVGYAAVIEAKTNRDARAAEAAQVADQRRQAQQAASQRAIKAAKAEYEQNISRIKKETEPTLVFAGVETHFDETFKTREGDFRGHALVLLVRNDATNLLGAAHHVTAEIEYVGAFRIVTASWLHEPANAVRFEMNAVKRLVVAVHDVAPDFAFALSDLRDESKALF
jgi:hypothetical protein